MKIDENQIESKAYAGKDSEGSPLVYIVTKGGLHAFFKKGDDGKIEAIAAAPHRGIAQFLAEQKDKDIKWDEDFLKKNDDELKKSEDDMFEQMRSLVFAPERMEKSEVSDEYFVYDTEEMSIQIMKKDEIVNEISDINEYCIVRNLSLTEPIYLLKDHPEFGKK